MENVAFMNKSVGKLFLFVLFTFAIFPLNGAYTLIPFLSLSFLMAKISVFKEPFNLILTASLVFSYLFIIFIVTDAWEIEYKKIILVLLHLLALLLLYSLYLKEDTSWSKSIGSFNHVFYCLLLIVIVFFMSQMVMFFKIQPLFDLTLKYYMVGDTFENAYRNSENLNSLRNGGLFINPNQMAKYLTIMFAFVLSIRTSLKNEIIFIFICSLSVILTGSRTGLIVFFLMFLFYYQRSFKSFLVVLVAIIIISPYLYLSNAYQRIVNSDENVGSIEYKIGITLEYFSNLSNIELFFGSSISTVDISNLEYKGYSFGFDSDIGYLLSMYGLNGFAFIFIVFIMLMRRRLFPVYIYPILLWSISSSLFFNLRTMVLIILYLYMCNIFRGEGERKVHFT